MSKVLGYNIKLAINGKIVIGRTSEKLEITAKVKESLTKDDNGSAQQSVVGHDAKFTIGALVDVGTNSDTTKMTRDDVIDLVLATGPSAVIPFVYTVTGATKTLYGNLIIENYSEDSDSESEASLNIGCRTSGAITTTAPSSGGSPS